MLIDLKDKKRLDSKDKKGTVDVDLCFKTAARVFAFLVGLCCERPGVNNRCCPRCRQLALISLSLSLPCTPLCRGHARVAVVFSSHVAKCQEHTMQNV